MEVEDLASNKLAEQARESAHPSGSISGTRQRNPILPSR